MSTVLVGIDASETAAEAARAAATLAAALGKSLTLVIAHPKGQSTHVAGPGGDSWDASAAQGALNTANRVAKSLREIVDEIAVVEATGKPADVLVEEAKRLDADIIVVGNRRMQGVGRVLGAIASSVAQHAPCDVHIVKTT